MTICTGAAALVGPLPPEAAAAAEPPAHLPVGTVDVAAAPLGYNGEDLIVARGTGGQLYYTTGAKGNWTGDGWKTVPLITSNTRVGMLGMPSGNVTLGAVRTNGVFVQTQFDVNTRVFGPVTSPGAQPKLFTAGPGMAASADGSQEYWFAVSADGIIHYIDMKAPTAGWKQWSEPNTTKTAISAVYFNGKFRVFINKFKPGAADPTIGTVAYSDFTPGTPPTWQNVPGDMETREAPSAALARKDVLTVVVRGAVPKNDIVMHANWLADGTWGPWLDPLPLAHPTWLTPFSVYVSTYRYYEWNGSITNWLQMYVVGHDGSIGVRGLKPGEFFLPEPPPGLPEDPRFLQPAGMHSLWYEHIPHSDPSIMNGPPPPGSDWTASLPAEQFFNGNGDLWAKNMDGVGAARLGTTAQDIVVARRKDTGRLYVSIGRFNDSTPEDANWSRFGWAEIPGGGTTPYAPSVAAFGDEVYVAVVSGNERMYYQVYNTVSKTWRSTWTEVPGNGLFSAGPTLAVWHGGLQAFGVGRAGDIYWLQGKSLSGVGNVWSDKWVGLGAVKTTMPVAALEFEHELVVAVRGGTDPNSDKIYLRTIASYGSGTIEDWWEPPGDGRTDQPPALAKGKFGLYLLARHKDGKTLAYQSTRANAYDENPEGTQGPSGFFAPNWRVVPPESSNATSGATGPPVVVSQPAGMVALIDVFSLDSNTPGLHSALFDSRAGGAAPDNAPKLGIQQRPGGLYWKVVPYQVPADSGGLPIPPPPPPGAPWNPPAQPAVNWYVFCLAGPAVPDGYIPTLDVSQDAGLAQAQEFATDQYGLSGNGSNWHLTFDANPAEGGCVEAPPPPPDPHPGPATWYFCAGHNLLHVLMTVWATGSTQLEAYWNAYAYVESVWGPEYTPAPSQVWALVQGGCFGEGPGGPGVTAVRSGLAGSVANRPAPDPTSSLPKK
ncbi:hypothetical protein [Micromonospora sp. NPDC051141]|uniref:hypothetical protein n=1 Tax=Micromonospora sp. NPDC051141 TaxID=3364284 RepID=UPI0037926676